MSNKIVPTTYRAIIDDVIANMRAEFEDYGVGEDVLGQLQDKWESKVIASRVAEFEQPPAPPQAPTSYAPQPTNNNRRSPHMNYTVPPGAHPPPSHYAGVPHVKTEAIDRPYIPMTQPMHHYVMPPMTAPPMPPRPGQGVLVLPRGAPPAAAATSGPPRFPTGSSGSGGRIPQLDGPSGAPPTNSQQIVQLDGPSSSESESSSPPPPDSKIASGSAPRPADTEEINSDLDDSESDADADEDPTATGGADTDIVFCTYDKVARVKNKWKCVLKDGMIHVNGKDYLFAKCSGEFEW